jgi:phospholipid/cholesterol/gamma-HCH transport system substrate-binding protein
MAKKEVNTTKLGIMVILGIILFAVGTYFIGNQDKIFQPMYRLSAMFSDVSGLKPGNNVRYAGVVVGSVERISFVNDSTLRVDMKLEQSIKEFIRKDAVAKIEMEGLVGSMIINISPGSGNTAQAEEGDIILSDRRPDVINMMKTLDETNNNLAVLSYQLVEIVDKVRHGEGTIPRLLNDEEMGRDVASGLAHFRATASELNQLSSALATEFENVKQGKGALGFLLKDEAFAESLHSISQQIDTTLEKRLDAIFKGLQSAGEELAIAGKDLSSAVKSIEDGDGLASYLLTDSSAVKDLQTTLDNLELGSRQFNDLMEALRHHVLFRNAFKRLDKQQDKQ